MKYMSQSAHSKLAKNVTVTYHSILVTYGTLAIISPLFF